MRTYEKVKEDIITLNHYLLTQLDNPKPIVIEKIRSKINLLIDEAIEAKKYVNEKV